MKLFTIYNLILNFFAEFYNINMYIRLYSIKKYYFKPTE